MKSFYLLLLLLSRFVASDQDQRRAQTRRRVRHREVVSGAKHLRGQETNEGSFSDDSSYWERLLIVDENSISIATNIPTASPTAKPDPLPPAPTKSPVEATTSSPTKAPSKIQTEFPTKAPVATEAPTVEQSSKPSFKPSEADRTVGDIVVWHPELTILESLVESVDLQDVLNNPKSEITLFAPNDGAFMIEDSSLVADLLKAEYGLHLTDLLLNHLTLVEELFAIELTDGLIINTTSTFDEHVEISLNATDVFLETGSASDPRFEVYEIFPSKVVSADMDATNGVVHNIDRLLLSRWVYQDLVDAVESDFSILVDYAVSAGLDGVIRDATDSTLLAPTDAAFEALTQETKDFLEDPVHVETLREILKYHLVPQVFNYRLFDDESVQLPTEQGESIAAYVGSTQLDGPPLPTFSDVSTSYYALSRSGVIYAIDEVLIPPSLQEPSPSPTETPTRAPSEEKPVEFTVMDVVDTRSNLSVLQTAVNASGLRDGLDSSANTITLFAPSNFAFMAVDPSLLMNLLTPEYGLHLSDLLLYHVALGEELSAADLTDGLQFATASTESETLLVNRTDGVKLITAAARDPDLDDLMICPSSVVAADIDATNGVVHEVNEVLQPTWAYNDLIDTTLRYPDKFSEITNLVVLAGLEGDIRELDGSTLLLPNNAAIEALGDDTLKFLKDPDNVGLLQGILSYHLIEEVFNYQLYEGQESTQLTASQGSVIDVTFTDDINVRLFNDVTSSNVYLSKSGIIYELDGVLTPPISEPGSPAPTSSPSEAPSADEPGSTESPTAAPTTKSQKKKSVKAQENINDGVSL